jgi:hypothetical protein
MFQAFHALEDCRHTVAIMLAGMVCLSDSSNKQTQRRGGQHQCFCGVVVSISVSSLFSAGIIFSKYSFSKLVFGV